MNKVLLYTGNTIIILSLAGFVFIFYPIISLYLFPPPPVEATKELKGTFITIPKINAFAPVILDVDPWDPKDYKAALKQGVAHAKGTVLPGSQKGMTFLFAHSSGPPWEQTRFNTIFLRLGELEKEEAIIIVRDGETFTYTVTDKKEVWPNEVNYLLDTSKDRLILQTCTPIGTDLKRLLVFAELQD